MTDSDYPTETLSLEFFGGKEVQAGSRETIEVVSVNESVVQVRCVGKGKKGERPDMGKEAASRYQEKMGSGGMGGY